MYAKLLGFTVLVFTLTPLSLKAAQQQPEWTAEVTQQVQQDFAERLSAVESDVSKRIGPKGQVLDTEFEWVGEAIPVRAGLGYYQQAAFDPSLDLMLANSLPEARSQYAAALESGKWNDGIVIVGVGDNGEKIDIANIGGQGFPLLTYDSIEEIGMTEEDKLAEKLLVQHLTTLDPSGELLAQCREIERQWFAAMDEEFGPQQYSVSRTKTMLCSTRGSNYRSHGSRSRSCRPCGLQNIPRAPSGTAYGYRPSSCSSASSGRARGGLLQLFRRRGGSQPVSYTKYGQQNLQIFKRLDLGPQRFFTENLSNPYYKDCNMGILMGVRGMVRGDWRPRVIRQDQNYLNMGILKKIAAHAIPRKVGMNNCLDCRTIQGLVGRRLMIAIKLATMGGGGNGGGQVSHPAPTPTPMPMPMPMPMPNPGMPMMPGLD